jgi:hypothetical protein
LALVSVRDWDDTTAISVAGRNRWIEKSNDLIRNGTRDLPACSTVQPTNQPTMLSRPPLYIHFISNWNWIEENGQFHDPATAPLEMSRSGHRGEEKSLYPGAESSS